MTSAAIALYRPVTAIFRRTIWSEKSDIRPFIPGATIAEIVNSFELTPEFYGADGPGGQDGFGGVYLRRDHIDPGTVVSREHWHRVRPKPGMELFISLIPEGGGGDSAAHNKQIFAAVAALALIVVSYGIASTGLGFLSPALAKGAAAGVAIVGGLELRCGPSDILAKEPDFDHHN